MYQIGDFSQLGQVSVRMLRHYDKLGLLKPGHVDQWTNYRYYTLEQTTDLEAGPWSAVPGVSNVMGSFQTVTHAIPTTGTTPGFFRGKVDVSQP